MSKKTFTAAPKPKPPSAEAIEAYEQGGAGHDQRPAPVKPAEPTKRLSLDLPASVHTRFKTACSATGHKMVSEIQDFIKRRTAELEAEAGILRR
jgi:hypothetical protein